MKLTPRLKHPLLQTNETETNFLQQLQNSLLTMPLTPDIGIDQFEKVYQKKRVLAQTIDEYRSKNKFYMADIQKAKQRIYQIQQLSNKANKQSTLMQNRINKINDAHMISKILIMEKILKLGIEHQNLQRKRQQCSLIKEQKNRLPNVSHSLFEKRQRTREISVVESRALREQLEDLNYHTIETNRERAERVRSEKERRREKLARYQIQQKFKLQQAKKNHQAKTQTLRRNIHQNNILLTNLYLQQKQSETHFHTTELITKQYLDSICHSPQHSTLENSNIFPTQFA